MLGGQKQGNLECIIGLLKKLGSMPASKEYMEKPGYHREDATLFEELSGYSWRWSGEGWVKSLEEIQAHYKAESERVKKALEKKRGY